VVPQSRHARCPGILEVVIAGVVGDQPRIALGSVAPTVVRAARTEAALAAGASIEEAQRMSSRKSSQSTTSDPPPSIAGASPQISWRGCSNVR